MTDVIVHASQDTFDDEVLQSSKPVLVDYWADWCNPCKTMAPALEGLAEDYSDRLKVVKVNVEDNPDVSTRFKIRGLPTVMLFQNGDVVATKVGAMTKAQLTELVESHL